MLQKIPKMGQICSTEAAGQLFFRYTPAALKSVPLYPKQRQKYSNLVTEEQNSLPEIVKVSAD